MRRVRFRYLIVGAIVLVAASAIGLTAVDSDTDDPNDLDAAIAEAADAARADEDPVAAIARVFSARERAFDETAYEQLLQAGDVVVASGTLPTDYAHAAEEEDGSSMAFLGFVLLVDQARRRRPRDGPT